MPPAPLAPSMGLVRAASDRRVLAHLLESGRATRAGLATATGLSKPTVSESVRRLADDGLVVEAGRQAAGRGRSGTWCRLGDAVPAALAVHAGPGLLTAQVVDVHGATRAVVEHPMGLTVTAEALAAALRAACEQVEVDAGVPIGPRLASVADPVDRRTGRTVHLEGAPFVLGEVDVRDALGAETVVDNDVHWAALAYKDVLAERGIECFAYVYLGPGMGAALVDDGRLLRGARGLAGELAYAPSVLPDGRVDTLLAVVAALGVVPHGGTAVDVDAVLRRFDAGDLRVAQAVADAVLPIGTLLDPQAVVVTGPWGSPEVRSCIGAQLGGRVEVLAGGRDDGAFPAVRSAAVRAAREALLASR